MATSDKNLSLFDLSELGNCKGLRIGIVTAKWNTEITSRLHKGALKVLKNAGISKDHIHEIMVPGSFELVSGARILIGQQPVDAVICLGCLVKGETPHFEYICQAVSNGLVNLNLSTGLPFIFGVLTTNDLDQARERAGGKHGNKGEEAAYTALSMALLSKDHGGEGTIGFSN